jgi:adenosylmethionine-8-amino-7-oxononanoate aminotransferase
MCGMGRTGSLFAFTQEDIEPDIVTVAKGLGAGYQPVGAAICSAKIYAAFEQGSGFFQHGHTYMGHPVAAAAADAVLSRLLDDGLAAGVEANGRLLERALHARLGQHPHVGDIRGRGLFRGIELVADRGSKAPFGPGLNLNGRIKRLAFEAGLICYPGGGTIDGRAGDHVLLAPPFIVSPEAKGCER